MKKLALRALRSCGAFVLARNMSAQLPRILMYHNFSDASETGGGSVGLAAARTQLDYLRRHFHVVPLSVLAQQLQTGVIDQWAVALTVDDGRRNFYEVFYPLLKEFRLPTTFFVVSSFIRREDWIWTDKVQWLAEQLHAPGELQPHKIGSFFEMLNRLRPEIRNALINRVATSMNLEVPREPPPKYAPCTWSELKEMAASGLVEIGSHTVSHSILSTLTDEESWRELTISREQIENGLGTKVECFCFPNGKPSDYRPSHLRQLDDAGYKSAVVASCGLVSQQSAVFELPRIGISGETDMLWFSKYVDGAEYFQTKIVTSLAAAPRVSRPFHGGVAH